MKKICNRVAIAVGVLGTIGSYAAAASINSFFTDSAVSSFNFLVFLGCLASTFFCVVPFFALGSILENQEKLLNILSAADKKCPTSTERIVLPVCDEDIHNSSFAKLNDAQPIFSNSEPYSGTYAKSKRVGEIVCTACGEMQKNDRKTCYNCGSVFTGE